MVCMDVEALYREYGPMVMRRCRQLLKDEDEALDVMQDVFVQVLRRGDRLNDQYPSSLLYRIATNLSLNRIRDRRRGPETANDDLVYRLAIFDDNTLDQLGAAAVLEALFAREQVSTRTMATLHYVDGLTLEETASEMGMSVSGVRKRLRTLRAHLQGLIDETETV